MLSIRLRLQPSETGISSKSRCLTHSLWWNSRGNAGDKSRISFLETGKTILGLDSGFGSILFVAAVPGAPQREIPLERDEGEYAYARSAHPAKFTTGWRIT